MYCLMGREVGELPMRSIFEVEVVSPETGATHWTRVEAGSRAEAISRLVGMGETVGEARLSEVLATPAARNPSLTYCPKCEGTEWKSTRGSLFALACVIFFPISLLFLLDTPRYRCIRCGETVPMKTPPMDASTRSPVVSAFDKIALVALASLLVVIGAVMLARSI